MVVLNGVTRTRLGCFTVLILLIFLLSPNLLKANGLLDRANHQYAKRDYTDIGMESVSAARANYSKVVTNLMNTEGEYARARMLQSIHFLVTAGSKQAKIMLQSGIGEASQGVFYFDRVYGRTPFKSPDLNERGRKIYADLLYWKAMIFSAWINDQGGGFQNEKKKITQDMQLVVSQGYGCLNDGGAYRILGQFFEAYKCTLVTPTSGPGTDPINWNGENVLSWADQLLNGGRRVEAVQILKKLISVPAEELSFDFVPENTRAQKVASQKLASLGLARPLEAVPGEFVIQFKSAKTLKRTAVMAGQLGQVKEFINDDIAVIRRPLVEQDEMTIQRIKKIPEVLFVEPNYIFKINRIPNEPRFNEMWALNNTGQEDPSGQKGLPEIDIDILRAWDITVGTSSMVVGIIDTGVDFSSPDLKENAWINELEFHGKPGVDDDENGYVDDINGYDFINNKSVVVDDHGHGTHVAGTIGAQGNNESGVVGINWKIRIMALKFLDANGGGTLAAAIKAIRYATMMGAKITNNSWGGGAESEILKSAIDDAGKAGVLFVAAAGNSGENMDVMPHYPSSYPLPNIISVAALNNRGELADFSNFGSKTVHLAAPGENILSITPNGMKSWSGTSMATPHVAGVAALLMANEPTLSAAEVKERLLSSARPMIGLRNRTMTGGLINAFFALTQTKPNPDPYDPGLWLSKESQVSSNHNYQYNERKTFEFQIPDAQVIRLHFSKFQTEPSYDRMIFFDEENHFIGVWSGNHNDEYGPPLQGSRLRIQLLTDGFINDYGFEVNKIMYKY